MPPSQIMAQSVACNVPTLPVETSKWQPLPRGAVPRGSAYVTWLYIKENTFCTLAHPGGYDHTASLVHTSGCGNTRLTSQLAADVMTWTPQAELPQVIHLCTHLFPGSPILNVVSNVSL